MKTNLSRLLPKHNSVQGWLKRKSKNNNKIKQNSTIFDGLVPSLLIVIRTHIHMYQCMYKCMYVHICMSYKSFDIKSISTYCSCFCYFLLNHYCIHKNLTFSSFFQATGFSITNCLNRTKWKWVWATKTSGWWWWLSFQMTVVVLSTVAWIALLNWLPAFCGTHLKTSSSFMYAFNSRKA